ncbi:LysR family transcriptional regulator [Sphingomonas sp.]|uniref:LysR family transcriptional regulator n=1 Tax=Sphingomonas sp. TaxID=28214 RepID=UPI003B001887
MRPELLNGLTVFRAVAAERSFTRAATRLGVTQSALSQAIRRLEAELGIRLLDRTTRSVTPNAAGERLLATLEPALAGIEAELASLADLAERPAGRIRVTAGRHAADAVLAPAIVRLLQAYPSIAVEASVDDRYVDIVAEGFDAGIRLRERLENDMIAVRVSPTLRMAVVATPAYWSLHGRPAAPEDLRRHPCITFRSADGGTRPWEFEKDGRELAVKVGGSAVFNDAYLMREAALAGVGPTYLMEDVVDVAVEAGLLERVLADWCEPFEGYHLYYPHKRHQTQAFQLFLEAIRAT